MDFASISPKHAHWFERATEYAEQALCLSARCGAVVVQGGRLLAGGYNAPPGDSATRRRCGQTAQSGKKPKSDRTCCVHAEWRALTRALNNPHRHSGILLEGATLYFLRIGDAGEVLPSGHPYCTVCSRLALDLGVERWVLWHADGVRVYAADVYDDLSHQYDLTVGLPFMVPVV